MRSYIVWKDDWEGERERIRTLCGLAQVKRLHTQASLTTTITTSASHSAMHDCWCFRFTNEKKFKIIMNSCFLITENVLHIYCW